VHRNAINGAMVVSTQGSDSRIGDAIGGSGDGNQGLCGNQGRCPITVLADASGAAQRVTLRDPFPRALFGLVGNGVAGGDDDPTHANNWAQTPTISSAYTYDNFATVEVRGTANPLSLVDIYFDDQVALSRQTPVMADATGAFTFTGPLPGQTIEVFAVSTLNDAAHPNRVGSSSQFSGQIPVVASSGPSLSAVGSVANLSRPADQPAQPGDVVRFTVTMTSSGSAAVTDINGSGLHVPPGLAVLAGSGAVHGDGVGFVATDSGFSSGALAPGESASYSLDATVTSAAQPGTAVFELQVNADQVAAIPVVASLHLAGLVRLPLVMR
jgi:hypothetical protein